MALLTANQPNFYTAKLSADFADAGYNSANTRIIYERATGFYKFWKPVGISSISAFTAGKGYLIFPLTTREDNVNLVSLDDIGAIDSIEETRILTTEHTAFALAGKFSTGEIFVIPREAVEHNFSAGGKPVLYLSSDNGANYTRSVISMAGIPSPETLDIRNYSGGIYEDVIYLFVWAGVSGLATGDVYLMKSINKGVSWVTTLITFSGSYTFISGYGNLIFCDGKLLVPFYGQSTTPNISNVILLQSDDEFATYTERTIVTGNTSIGSNWVNETSIYNTTGTTVIAITRREDNDPWLSKSLDGGTTWANVGSLTVANSVEWHCPMIYSHDNKIWCLFADRETTHKNTTRLHVSDDGTVLASWNASRIDVVGGSYEHYIAFIDNDFGYPFVIEEDESPMMVWYDLGLTAANPRVPSDNWMDIIISKLHNKPMEVNARPLATTGLAAAKIALDFVELDNEGCLSGDFKSITIPTDGMYAVTGNLGVTVSNTLILNRIVENGTPTSEVLLRSTGTDLILSGICYLRQGEVVEFIMENNFTRDMDVVGNFSVKKIA